MQWTVRLAVAGCLSVLVLATPCCCEPMGGPDSVSRPTRPKSFASPDDLRIYLDQLGQYFAVVGRPRFGKRMMPVAAVSKPLPREVVASYSYPQQPPQPSQPDPELYDIVQYYQPQQQE